MIIWSRWGILVFVFVGLSVGFGFILKAIIAPDVDTNGPTTNILIGTAFILIGGAGLWAFSKYVLPKMDKPTPAFIYEKLPEPVVHLLLHPGALLAVPARGHRRYQRHRRNRRRLVA